MLRRRPDRIHQRTHDADRVIELRRVLNSMARGVIGVPGLRLKRQEDGHPLLRGRELQHEATDPSVRVDKLLRKAVTVATTLGSDDFRVWAAKELEGYAGETTIPAYRRVTGLVRAFHPARGWIPVVVPDKELQKRLETRAAGEPIGELEDLYHDPHRGDMLLVGPGTDAENLTLEDLMELVPYG